MSVRGKLLYNRVRVGELARVYLRDGWRDLAWEGTDQEHAYGETLTGRVIGVTGHRMSLGLEDTTHVCVLRRVDIEGIEVNLGA